jgi:hypothetical protein
MGTVQIEQLVRKECNLTLSTYIYYFFQNSQNHSASVLIWGIKCDLLNNQVSIKSFSPSILGFNKIFGSLK